MKKKQVFAVLLASCMTLSYVPTFAAADLPVAETSETTESIETLEGQDETPAVTPSETPAEGADGEDSGLVQNQGDSADDPSQQTTPPAETPGGESGTEETPTDPEQEPEETPEQTTGTVYVGEKAYASIEEAIAETAKTAKEAAIVLKGDQTIQKTVTIPAGFRVQISAEKDTVITRAADAKGPSFAVKGSLKLEKKENTGTITVVGAAKAEDTLFAVDGTMEMGAGITIKENHTSKHAGAISNKGTLVMTGGTITKNSGDKGAVSNAGTMQVSGSVIIENNHKADKKTAANVVLAEKAVITVAGKLADGAKIGVLAEKEANGTVILKAGKDVKLEEAGKAFVYDGRKEIKIDQTGALTGVPDEPTADTTAPVLKEVEAERIAEDTALIVFRSDEAGVYYCSIDDPDVDTTGKGMELPVDVDVEYQVNGLAAGEHTAYIVAKDAAGNVSTLLSIAIPSYAKIANPEDNTINGLQDSYSRVYISSKKKYGYLVSFSVTGAGMDFPEEKGNVRYMPLNTYKIGDAELNFGSGYKGLFSGTVDPGTYKLEVTFEQQEYDGNEWVATGEVDVKTADVVLKDEGPKITATPTKKPSSSTASTSKNKNSKSSKTSSVKTGDETDVVPIVFLGGSAAALAGAMITMKKKRQQDED